MRVAFYLSSHGYGHAARMAGIVCGLLDQGSACLVNTDRPRFLFEPQEHPRLQFRDVALDFGLRERDWAHLDREQTLHDLLELDAHRDELIAREVAALHAWGAELVVADVPPLAFTIAHVAGIPSVGISNFDWLYMYRRLLPDSPATQRLLRQMAADYALADLALRLPCSSEESMNAFPRCESVGLIAPHAVADRRKLCRTYGIPPRQRIVLVVSRTGHEFDMAQLCTVPDTVFLGSVDYAHERYRRIPPNSDYTWLSASVDVVLTKAGYGVLSSAMQAGTFILATDRADYPEDPLLLAELERYGHGLHLPHTELPGLDWPALFTRIGRPRKRILRRYRNQNREVVARILAMGSLTRSRKTAVIDVGTNMAMLLWATYEHGRAEQVFRATAVTALGRGMHDGVLRPAGIRRAKWILGEYLAMTRHFTDDIHIFGTSCSRRAKNIHELSDGLQRRYGIHYRILSGDEEARCSGLLAMREFPEYPSLLSFDIGGGSTEFMLAQNGTPLQKISLELGLRQLDNDFGHEVPKKLAYIHEALTTIRDWPVGDAELIAIGGSGCNLAAVKHGLTHYDQELVHKTVITLADIARFKALFEGISVARIRELMPFEPERAEIILSGVYILEAVMKLFGKDHVVICDRGLHLGYFYDLIEKS